MRLVAAALACVASLCAQSPSSWSTLSPPGGVDPARISAEKACIVYRDGLYMRVYSAITRQWYALTPSFGTSFQLRDHLVAVPESDRWTLFSAHTGTTQTLLVNTATTTWSASESLFVVRDGDTAHVFSSYTGQWHTHTAPASWFARVEDRVATFFDPSYGPTTAGAVLCDGFTGQWHTVPATNESMRAVSSGGTALFLLETHAYGFSALRGSLDLLPDPGYLKGGTIVQNSRTDLVQYRGTAYSGVTGAFTPSPHDPLGINPSHELRGLIVRGGLATNQAGVASGTGSWHALPPGSITAGWGLTWIAQRDGLDVVAFSAVTGGFATKTLQATAPAWFSRDHVSVFVDGIDNLPRLYSGLTGRWYDAPANTEPYVGPFPNWATGDNGVVLRTTTGLLGWSAHTGTFTPLAGAGWIPVAGHSSALGAWNGTELAVFDAARDRWRSVPLAITAAQPPVVSTVGWPSAVLLAEDANTAAGFSAITGHLETLSLSEPVLDRSVRGDVAWLRTASHLHVFTGFGEHTSWSNLPFDLVAVGRGSTLRHQVRLVTGEFALLGLGPRLPAPVSLPPFGDVWLDLNATGFALLQQTGASWRVPFDLAIPTNAALQGTEWFLQPLMLRNDGSAQAAAATSIRVL